MSLGEVQPTTHLLLRHAHPEELAQVPRSAVVSSIRRSWFFPCRAYSVFQAMGVGIFRIVSVHPAELRDL